MIEIVDRVLKLLEHVLLALAVAGDVGDGPHRRSGLVRLAERPHPQPQPARRLPARAGHPHFLLQAPAFLGGLAQAIDRLRHVGVADEDALDRAHLFQPDGVGKHSIGGIGEQHPPGAVGDDDAVMGVVDDALEHRVAGIPRRDPQHAGGEGEHREHPDHRQQGEKDHHVRPGLVAADHHETGGGDDQEDRNQQDQRDAAAAFAPRDHRRAQARRCHDEPYPPLLRHPPDSSLPQQAALRKGMLRRTPRAPPFFAGKARRRPRGRFRRWHGAGLPMANSRHNDCRGWNSATPSFRHQTRLRRLPVFQGFHGRIERSTVTFPDRKWHNLCRCSEPENRPWRARGLNRTLGSRCRGKTVHSTVEVMRRLSKQMEPSARVAPRGKGSTSMEFFNDLSVPVKFLRRLHRRARGARCGRIPDAAAQRRQSCGLAARADGSRVSR